MAIATSTLITYDDKTIREDLMEAENLLDKWETPFISMIAKKGKSTNTKHEWPLVTLIGPLSNNRRVEGEDALVAAAPIYASRRSNYTQISTKLIILSDTSQWVDGAASIEKISKQVSYKLKELKTDKETMLLDNVIAIPGNSTTARQAAGFPAFIITNKDYGALAAPSAPALSGTTDGYPSATFGTTTSGTDRPITESLFRTVMLSCWNSGGRPRYALTTAALKSKISETFSGSGTSSTASWHVRNVDDASTKLTLATDVYKSDFGEVQIVPDRYMLSGNVYFIDPDYVSVDYGQDTTQKDIARTGLAEKRLISCEYTLTVANEAAHGVLSDVT